MQDIIINRLTNLPILQLKEKNARYNNRLQDTRCKLRVKKENTKKDIKCELQDNKKVVGADLVSDLCGD